MTLTIRIKRHPDGSASLTCIRADRTSTWQRQVGGYALVFPSHDLTHVAVETELGYERGFYGLIAEGWEIVDFAPPFPRGSIPREAREVELIVSIFESEWRDGGAWTVDEFNASAARYVAAQRELKPALASVVPRVLTADELERVRATRDALLRRWGAVRPGDALELSFEPTARHTHAARTHP